MLSIILYALIAVGTSKPIYERYKNTPQIKMTWSLFFFVNDAHSVCYMWLGAGSQVFLQVHTCRQ